MCTFICFKALLSKARLLHNSRLQSFKGILSLAAPNQLPNPRHKHIHGRYCLPVLVELHVKGLDVLGVVIHNGRLLEYLLTEIPALKAYDAWFLIHFLSHQGSKLPQPPFCEGVEYIFLGILGR
jgi:hypothetical protein